MQRLALRVTPDVNAPVVTNLAEGQVVVGLAQSAQGYWTAVEAGGKRGWAASQWLHPITNQQ
jgi:pilus assembly protein CpaC